MSIAPRSTQPWYTQEYLRIASATFEDGELVVVFEDQTRVSVDPQRLLSPDDAPPLWDRLTFNPYEIIIPTELDHVDVPWDVIRSLTDAAFEAHLAAAAKEQARWIGCRIEELRRAQHMTGADVAQQAGIDAATLSRIEPGDHEVRLPLLERILTAVGGTFDDLIRRPLGQRLIDDEQASRPS